MHADIYCKTVIFTLIHKLMKQKIYILGVITAMIVFTGTIFKINHYPGAGILLIIGISSLVLLFLPLALENNYRAAENRKNLLIYIITYITCFVVFTSMLFKLLHWPHAGTLLTIAIPFPYVVFLPVFIIITSKDKNFNVYNTVFVLLLLALNSVLSGLLALNVTSERIADSYQLSRNYINQQRGLSLLPVSETKSAVNIKIDEVIKFVNECQKKVLEQDGKTLEQWKHEPGNLVRPDFRGSFATGLGDAGEQFSLKLQNKIEELIKLMEITPGYESLAINAAGILNFKISPSDSADWFHQVFNDFPGWVLIYFDALESNLILIKASFSSIESPA
jgi:hypothetical protein